MRELDGPFAKKRFLKREINEDPNTARKVNHSFASLLTIK